MVGSLAYIALLVMLRVAGQRSLSKMNAFDFIITIALGSAFSSMILDKTTTLAEGLVTLALLVGLQMAVAWLATHSPQARHLMLSDPVMLAYRGELCRKAMRNARISQRDVEQALREHGLTEVTAAQLVVLEPNGQISVLKDSSENG